MCVCVCCGFQKSLFFATNAYCNSYDGNVMTVIDIPMWGLLHVQFRCAGENGACMLQFFGNANVCCLERYSIRSIGKMRSKCVFAIFLAGGVRFVQYCCESCSATQNSSSQGKNKQTTFTYHQMESIKY